MMMIHPTKICVCERALGNLLLIYLIHGVTKRLHCEIPLAHFNVLDPMSNNCFVSD